jgi:predicted permease
VTQAGLTLAPIEVHMRVLMFAAALGLVAGLAFGLLPALETTAPDLVSGARRDGLALGGRIRPQRLAGLLVGAQVTASLVLLVLASLLLRSAQSASRLDAGYDVGRLIDLRFPHPDARTLARLRENPRVAAASATGRVPLQGSLPRHSMIVDGAARSLRYNYVDETYFETLGLRLTAGRGFRAEEAAQRTPVVVISAATARILWPGQSALGRALDVTADGGPDRARYEVIGVVPDVVSGIFFQGRDPSAVYFPAAVGSPQATEILVRSRGETGATVEALRGFCSDVDRAVLCEPKTLRELAALQRFPFLAASVVASALGSLALVLTSIGLYGVVAFAVVQRVREVGIRLALGATPLQVLRLFLERAARNVLLGLAVGLPIGALLVHFAARFFGLDAFDPLTLIGVPLLLVVVALTAAFVPARRATLSDPMISLRVE